MDSLMEFDGWLYYELKVGFKNGQSGIRKKKNHWNLVVLLETGMIIILLFFYLQQFQFLS